MKNTIKHISLFLGLFLLSININAQKGITEGTLQYKVAYYSLDPSGNVISKAGDAVQTIYFKGTRTRNELSSSIGTSSTILDAFTMNATVLKDYSGQHLMIQMNKSEWLEYNKKYKEINFNYKGDTRKIGDYEARLATATLEDGSAINVYYTDEIKLPSKEYEPAFKNLKGIPLEYEIISKNLKVVYSWSEISPVPVSNQKFDIPKSGYRIMTFEESIKVQ